MQPARSAPASNTLKTVATDLNVEGTIAHSQYKADDGRAPPQAAPQPPIPIGFSIAKNGHISSTSAPLSQCETDLWYICRKLRGQSGDFRQKLTLTSRPRDPALKGC